MILFERLICLFFPFLAVLGADAATPLPLELHQLRIFTSAYPLDMLMDHFLKISCLTHL